MLRAPFRLEIDGANVWGDGFVSFCFVLEKVWGDGFVVLSCFGVSCCLSCLFCLHCSLAFRILAWANFEGVADDLLNENW